MPSPTPEQMAFAKQLQQEFRGRGSSRGGSNLRGRGQGPITAGPRYERQTYPPVRTNAMVRPMPAANRGGLQTQMGPAAAVQRAAIKINKDLSDWVDGGKPTKPADSSAPTSAVAEVNAQPATPQTKDTSSLAADIMEDQSRRAAASTMDQTGNTTRLGADIAASHRHPVDAVETQLAAEIRAPHLARKPAVVNQTTPSSHTVNSTKEAVTTKISHSVVAETHNSNVANNASKEATLIDLAVTNTPADKIKKHGSLTGQASRLLADKAPTDSNSVSSCAKTTLSVPAHNEPGFNLVEWAFQMLKSGQVLPPEEETAAHLSNGKQAVTEPPARMMDTKICQCPKRIRPLAGLSASKFNTDADGDRQVADMSEAAKRKFAVNVIKFDHPLEDCPTLLKAQADFPLWFGAIPATLAEQEDNLDVFPYQANKPEAPAKAHKVSGLGRGLNASIWA